MGRQTKTLTLFTDPPDGVTRELHASPPGTWTRLKLTLETAGPVSVGTNANLGTVLSGQGILLLTGVEREWDLQDGDRIYYVAESINRVQVSIESIAYGDDYNKTLAEIRDAELGVKSAVVAATPPAMRQVEIVVPKVVPRPPAPRMPVMPNLRGRR